MASLGAGQMLFNLPQCSRLSADRLISADEGVRMAGDGR